MAYRDRSPLAVCARHPRAAAYAQCARCLRDVCEPCASTDGLAIACPDCATAGRVRRSRIQSGLLTGALSAIAALLIGVGWSVSERAAWSESRPDVIAQLQIARDDVADKRPFAALRHIELLKLHYGAHPLFSQLHRRVHEHIVAHITD